jgi:catechol 2,3-dioxygenase-like lactoylglutathione lyase family enzyme
MYYLQLHYRRDDDPSVHWNTTWAILPAPQSHGAARDDYMINYRVDDLRALAAQLQGAGVGVDPLEEQRDGRTETSKGLFTHLRDPEGNRIELYQPL